MAEMTWHQAIQHVLADHSCAMHYQDITDQIVHESLRINLGATPNATVNAHLSGSIKRDGATSPYVRVDRGVYTLRTSVDRSLSSNPSVIDDVATENEIAGGLIHAIGMYWQRDAVMWSSAPALLGRERIGATAVDFSEQRGIYLLHDGREVIYVGRSVDRPLGRRLYEHTQDRLRARWDRFSWFGLLQVTEDGQLSEVSISASPDRLAATLEAILIEGLEPRQNRKRGDGFTDIEYLQADDPEIERAQMQQLLSSMQDKLSQR